MAYDLDQFLSLRRVGGLALAPDGSEAVITVAEVAPDETSMRSSLWSVDLSDPDGEPRQITRSSKGESSAAFLPDGSVVFVSGRADPDRKPSDDDDGSGLWRLPSGRGEAALLLAPPGGIGDLAVARSSGHIAIAVDVYPGADDLDADRERAKARRDAGVTAQLFERSPIRYWDHYLGPRERRYFVLAPDADAPNGYAEPRQVAVTLGLEPEASFDISDDGTTLVYERRRSTAISDIYVDLVVVDLVSGDQRVIAAGDDRSFAGPAIDHAGRRIACVLEWLPPGEATDATVWLIDLVSGEGRDLTPDLDLMPESLVWTPDDATIVFVTDDHGHRPAYAVDTGTGATRRITGDGAIGHVHVTPAGDELVALSSALDRPAGVVRVALGGGDTTTYRSPGTSADVPGRLVEMSAAADDGVAIHSWLVLPERASADEPAPLVVWVHGGPLGSWNDWSWRWNPWLLAERGYAVLLPDPAISTGYGHDFLARGHGAWGERPYTDVMAAVDAAVERPDIDGERTALMGGSFGGYMANWVAGHTDRFRCIVTHASLWALDQFHGTTDASAWWELEFGDPYRDPSKYVENSPHRFVDRITTPMLVIHGELDHRVPIGEALRLWTDLRRHGVESKFLYFPDENHWVLKPQNARIWYETVLAWLDHHLLGTDWTRPELL